MIARAIRLALFASAVVASLVLLAGCGDDAASGAGSPSPGGAPASGTKLAPGLYDLQDGTVQAVGVVEHRDLEGGFWAVIGGTEADGDLDKIVAVIANGDDFAAQFEALEGLSAIVEGTRLDGASIRMAGPEIKATGVVAASEGGPAE